MRSFVRVVICSIGLLIVACKREYPLPKEAKNLNLLVVEGLLNSGGSGPTVVRLSRTFNPTDPAGVRPELRAQVSVEGENGSTVALTGNTRGEYMNQLSLNGNQKYRLRIITTSGGEYVSDFVSVQPTPAIDSVHWKRTDEEINIFVSSHDPLNNTWYYRWEYEETWEINSVYFSAFQYEEPKVVPRRDPPSIFYCWRNEISTNILLNSSAKLTEDVISNQPLVDIPLGGEKISVRYSILVKQYSLTKEGYQFWEIMKKNTEQVGTLFDPQPSQLLSNIHSVKDNEEPVVGYVSAGSISEKRIFIRRNEVEPWRYLRDCQERMVPLDSLKFYFGGFQYIPLQEQYVPGGGLIGYTASTRLCVDCTVRGSSVKPAFW